MRALCSIGVFAESNCGFELTRFSEHLRRNSMGSVWSAAVMMPNEFGKAFDYLPSALRTGENTFKTANGALGWEYMSENPDRGTIFDAMMQALHGNETEAFIDAYDFSEAKIVIDIGGGNGDVLGSLLDKYKHLKGILFDRPDVVARTSDELKARGISDNCQYEGGDFFEQVPAGGDIYILRHIIHDWTDKEAISILKSCRTAIPETGRLLIVEGVIEPGNDPSSFKWLDLVMMLCWGGMERTREQYSRLAKETEFELLRIIPTTSEISILEFKPSVSEDSA